MPDQIVKDEKTETPPASITVKVGEEDKVLSVQDVSNLLSGQASATEKTQKATTVLDACTRYNVDPDTYVQHAQSAFEIVQHLQGIGILDENGEIVGQKQEGDNKLDTDGNSVVKKDVKLTDNANSAEAVVAKALEPMVKQMTYLAKNQDNMMRISLENDIKKKYPDFEDDDLARVFAKAAVDETKNVFQHAKDRAEEVKGKNGAVREALAKEFGVNLAEFDANKLIQQDATGGAAGIVEGKKIVFGKKKFGKTQDGITPKQAMIKYFNSLRA